MYAQLSGIWAPLHTFGPERDAESTLDTPGVDWAGGVPIVARFIRAKVCLKMGTNCRNGRKQSRQPRYFNYVASTVVVHFLALDLLQQLCASDQGAALYGKRRGINSTSFSVIRKAKGLQRHRVIL